MDHSEAAAKFQKEQAKGFGIESWSAVGRCVCVCVCAHCVRPSDVVTWKDYGSILRHMTRSAEKCHYGGLSREDSGGRQRDEDSALTLRCGISEEKTGSYNLSQYESGAPVELL